MTSADDFPGEMQEFPFNDRDADAVFGASSGAGSVPEEFRDVAELVSVARRTGSADELVGDELIVAQIAAAIGEPAALAPGDAHERIRVLSKFKTVKVTAAATAVLLFGATAAAAATGSLPGPVQSSVAHGLSGVGISVPVHHHHHAELAVKHTTPTVKPLVHRHHHDPKVSPGAFGTVASVNGVTTAGTCGTSGVAGAFTLTGPKGATFTVNVDTSTAFNDPGVTDPSFANVCIGELVIPKGTVTGMTVAATKVFVVPPRPPRPPHVPSGAVGTVASVNGVTTAGTCGTSGVAGAFTLTGHKGATFTVNVAGDTSTKFFEVGVMSPTFANVCVGEFVGAKGTVADTTVTATNVFIAPPHHEDKDKDKHELHHSAFGTVASVNGMTTAGTCGTADAAGTFTLTGFKNTTFTVNVDPSTKFFDFGVKDPSFANVCVGAKVGAIGDMTDTTVTATTAFVLPAHFPKFGDHDPKKGDGHPPLHTGFVPTKFKGDDHKGVEHFGHKTTGSSHVH